MNRFSSMEVNKRYKMPSLNGFRNMHVETFLRTAYFHWGTTLYVDSYNWTPPMKYHANNALKHYLPILKEYALINIEPKYKDNWMGKFNTGAANIPHDKKKDKGGEDAYYESQK